VLGGEMSANDPLPSLRQAEDLIRQAMAAGKPVIGHCLGGQLMARALGARVGDSPAPEVGWQALDIVDSDLARAWFGQRRRATVFQWHFEAFELPPGATLLAASAACPHQAFAIGPHLGMQFHIEVDAEKVLHWSGEHGERWSVAQRSIPARCRVRRPCATGCSSSWPATRRWPRRCTRAGWRRCPAGDGVIPASRNGPFTMRNSVLRHRSKIHHMQESDFTMWNAAAKLLILNEQVSCLI
jgi:GMP synthase-like glutamine amidotransferase